MAKVQVLHNAVVLSSSVSFEDLRKVEALLPEALEITKGYNENEETIFSVGTGECASASKYGVVFDKSMKVTVLLEGKTINEDLIKEEFGATILRLKQIEGQVRNVLEGVDAELEGTIEFVGAEKKTKAPVNPAADTMSKPKRKNSKRK